MGAGAVGCYYGGLLALAGYQVTLIGRQNLVESVSSKGGLLLERNGEIETIGLSAFKSAEAVSNADLILFTVKSGDTDSAARIIAPYIRPDTVVLSMQNGISNSDRISKYLKCQVIPVVVYVGAEIVQPGHVRYRGRGELVFPEGETSSHIVSLFEHANISATMSAQAEVEMWSKFVVNCCINAISALTRQSYDKIAAQEGAKELVHATMQECIHVADSCGINLPETLWDAVWGVVLTMVGQRSSTAQDLMRGNRTEIDYLNGEIVQLAKKFGIDVPINNALWVMVKLAE